MSENNFETIFQKHKLSFNNKKLFQITQVYLYRKKFRVAIKKINE